MLKNAPKCLLALLLAGSVFMAGCFGPKTPPAPAHLSAGGRQAAQAEEWQRRGCYQRAMGHLVRAYELFVAADQTLEQARVLNNIGNAHRAMGDPAQALLYYQESAAIFALENNAIAQRQAVANQGAALVDLGRMDEALKLLETISLQQKNGAKTPYGPAFYNMAVLHIRNSNLPAARAALKKAQSTMDEDDSLGLAAINYTWGVWHSESGDFEKAIIHFEKALALDRHLGNSYSIAKDLAGLGAALEKAGRLEDAVYAYKRAAGLFALMENPAQAQKVMDLLGPAALQTSQNLNLNRSFVEHWLSGKAYENPCGVKSP